MDNICKFLSNKDLSTCRCLNKLWSSLVFNALKKRSTNDSGPTINLSNVRSRGEDVSEYLKFLVGRKFKSIEWCRACKLTVFMDGKRNIASECVPTFIEQCARLVKCYQQSIPSITFMYHDLSDVLITEVVDNADFQCMFGGLEEIRFSVARLHHCYIKEDPAHLIRLLNSMPILTKLTLCYSRMFQQFLADEPTDFYCSALSGFKRLSQLIHLTITLNYFSAALLNNLNTMSSLTLLRIFVQGEADFNPKLFDFLRSKCPALKELHLIRLGALDAWSDAGHEFPCNDPEWYTNTRRLEAEFPHIKIVVEKRY